MKSIEEVIELWKDFESRANTKRSTQIARIKEDRSFLSGNQWEKADSRLIAKSRPRRVINVLANSVNSTANGYANYPYKWYSDNQEIDMAADAFIKNGSNNRAAYDVLYSEVAFGLGYFAIGSESVYDENGTQVEVPALYSIDKIENVYFDPIPSSVMDTMRSRPQSSSSRARTMSRPSSENSGLRQRVCALSST